MTKTILVTGSTDGIGLLTAKMLLAEGHRVLLHGRNPDKLAQTELTLSDGTGQVDTFVADLSKMSDVAELVDAIKTKYDALDVLINNAGVFSTAQTTTEDGLDVRFAVNTIAPYLLTKKLLSILGPTGRVVNLSSAAQSSVDTRALVGDGNLSDGEAYAQSKLALTMWSRHMGLELQQSGPMIVSVNPASMLGSKMVKDNFGVAGGDLSIGANILCRAALSDEFAQAAGMYFDNDIGQFSDPHPDAMDEEQVTQVIKAIESVLAKLNY